MSASTDVVGPPEKLSAEHDLSDFDSPRRLGSMAAAPRASKRRERSLPDVCSVRGQTGGGLLYSGRRSCHHAQVPGRIRRNIPDPRRRISPASGQSWYTRSPSLPSTFTKGMALSPREKNPPVPLPNAEVKPLGRLYCTPECVGIGRSRWCS